MIRLQLSYQTALAAVAAVRVYACSLSLDAEFAALDDLAASLAYAVSPKGSVTVFYLRAEDAQRFLAAVRFAVHALIGNRAFNERHPMAVLNALLPTECREVEPADAYDPDVCPAP